MNKKRPIIGIPADVKQLGEHPYNVVGSKYIDAISDIANCTPLLIPAIGNRQDIASILGVIDGLFLTGAVSNVEPSRYGKSPINDDVLLDKDRDATTLPLIEATLNANIPLLGVCRGFQELNVAMGGTLFQAVHMQDNMMDHRERSGSLDVQYGPAHKVKITKDGRLAQLFAQADKITVNSIHGQGIDRLGNHLTIEATAPDGLVEAISVSNTPSFALAVQWHPEWKASENKHSIALFEAFGRACKTHKTA
jgi:putative glutamine amidotransferase